MAASRAFKQAGRVGLRWLYFIHRWMGVAACLFFAMWFGSGVVMMYVPFPSLTQAERLAGLPQIDWSQVRVAPGEALAAAGVRQYPAAFKLEMRGAEPVYRITDSGARLAVSAATGQRLAPVDPEAALAIVRAFKTGAKATYLRTLERDQWSVAGGFDRHRPLHLFDAHDGRGGRLYVSSQTGEVVLDTHRAERGWNWVGSVPHWLYPTVLRTHQPAWRQVVMWVSGLGIVSAVTGMWIGLLRVRWKRRRAGQAISPYSGWMKWHHWAGLIGGLALTTWIVSGWLSVNPFRWFDTPEISSEARARYAGQSAPVMPVDPARLAAAGRGAVQADFVWLAGRPLVVLTDASGSHRTVQAQSAQPAGLTNEALFSAGQVLMPGARLALKTRLTAEDDYWYSHSDRRPLPALRLGFDDPARTWIYVDPATGALLDVDNASSRAYRWAFAGLHDLDFRFLLHRRPAWDLVMWLLSAVGMITSVSGVVIGWRRLTRRRPS